MLKKKAQVSHKLKKKSLNLKKKSKKFFIDKPNNPIYRRVKEEKLDNEYSPSVFFKVDSSISLEDIMNEFQ